MIIILESVKFQDPTDFIKNNYVSPGSYIYDPHYVVYKLQDNGYPTLIEEGYDVQIFKQIEHLP